MADTLAGHDSATGASIPHPEDGGGEWDTVKLGPHVLPGVWSVRGSVKRRIDVKTSKGQDGARFKDQGYKPGQLTLTGQLVGASDWNAMVKINKVITPRNRGTAMEPLACEHPSFTMLGITNVMVVEALAPVERDGIITCVVVVQEWMKKPKKKPAADDIPHTADSFADGSIQREARARAWQTTPNDEFDQLNISGALEALPGLEGTAPKSWEDLGLDPTTGGAL